MDATCKTCPMATPWTPTQDGKPRILCHHVASMDGGGEPERYETWFCSEHPLRQRDRLAAMAMQGILSSLPTEYQNATLPYGDSAQAFASQAYEIADALLAARAPEGGGRGET